MLTRLRFSRLEALRGSGDDFENWFYQLDEAPGMIHRKAFSRKIYGAEAQRLGGEPSKSHRLALRVLGMGSANAPDIAQTAHEEVLRRHGCLAPENVLR